MRRHNGYLHRCVAITLDMTGAQPSRLLLLSGMQARTLALQSLAKCGTCYAPVSRRQLQISTPAPAEQTVSHDRGSHDHYRVAFVFLQVALGARAIRGRMGLAVCRTCHRRQSSGVPAESAIFLCGSVVAGATCRASGWPSAFFSFKIAPS